MRTRGIKTDSYATSSSVRPRTSFVRENSSVRTAQSHITPVVRTSTRIPRLASTRKEPDIRPAVDPACVPHGNFVHSTKTWGTLRQITPKGAKWTCRSDLRVGRSLIRRAHRGLFCLNWTPVLPREKIVPYWYPGCRPRLGGFDAGKRRYWYGTNEHGYINLEGAELKGYLAGLINDNGKFDDRTCNCEIRWDEETCMYWVFADDRGWEAGTVCELYVYYGSQYWFHNFHLLTKKSHKLFHRRHLKDIQKMVDEQENLEYINPFTGLPMPKTGTPIVATKPVAISAPARRPGGRPPNRKRDKLGHYV